VLKYVNSARSTVVRDRPRLT